MAGLAAGRDGRVVARLDGPTDEAGFRACARQLAALGVAPQQVSWRTEASALALDLFDDTGPLEDLPPADSRPPLTVPRAYAELLPWVLLHREPDRFAALYALLWRLQHEPALRSDPLDPAWVQARERAQAVRRDWHKMKAYVRFRSVARPAPETPWQVAWFEPTHHVVERAAPYFVQRYANLVWRILTPLRSLAWDGEQLHLGDPADPSEAPPPDAGEALWLTYCEHIFNPARLKLATMAREMPRRYWKNLPEATLIQPLAAQAHQRSLAMVERLPSEAQRALRPAAPAAARSCHPPPVEPGAEPGQRQQLLSETARAAGGCIRCPLHAGATQVVFGEGPVDATLMVVGEQPGDQEDLRGQPFVGPSGQLFDRALAELGLDRAPVYVTNAVKHFKYGLHGQRRIHKTPVQQEAAACLDWLEREIALVRPVRLLALGATAARALLGRPVAVMQQRGEWLTRDDGLQVLVTLHPSALLRMPPAERDQAWSHWLADLARAFDAAGDRRARPSVW